MVVGQEVFFVARKGQKCPSHSPRLAAFSEVDGRGPRRSGFLEGESAAAFNHTRAIRTAVVESVTLQVLVEIPTPPS
jgi:hypothetical protein